MHIRCIEDFFGIFGVFGAAGSRALNINMQYGFYTDNKLETFENWPWRCPKFSPLPAGKKNVAVLGCSHTYGVGLDENETWVHHISQHNTKNLRYWNLGQPGASADAIVKILYASEKVIFPKIIIVMWPQISRRLRLEDYPANLMGSHETLRYENYKTDLSNFHKNVFFVEKFAEHNKARTIHCFSDDFVDFRTKGNEPLLLDKYTLRNCWPYWNSKSQRRVFSTPDLAKDGKHLGINHHKRFAEIFLEHFSMKLK